MFGEPDQPAPLNGTFNGNQRPLPGLDTNGLQRFIEQLGNASVAIVAFSVQMLIRYDKGRKFVNWKLLIGLWVFTYLFAAFMVSTMPEPARKVLDAPRYDVVGIDPYGQAIVQPADPFAGMTEEEVAKAGMMLHGFSAAPLIWFCYLVTAACAVHQLKCWVRYFRGDRILDEYGGDSILTRPLGRWFSQITIKRFFEPVLVFLAAFVAGGMTENLPLLFYLVLASVCLFVETNRAWRYEYDLGKMAADQMELARWRTEMMRRQMGI